MTTLLHSALLSALLAGALHAAPNAPFDGAAADGAAVDGAADARALFDRMCRAMLLIDASRAKPVTALDLELEVLVRDQQSNVAKPRIRWLAPYYVHSKLESGREQARGPDGYWLRDGGEVRVLEGREYAEDRRQIDEQLLTLRNFAALTQPSKLDISSLRSLEGLPAEIGRGHDFHRTRFRSRLQWIAFESRDIQLVLPTAGPRRDPPANRIRIGIDRDTALPVLVLVDDPRGEVASSLLHLSDIRPLNDVRVPHAVMVYSIVPGTPGGFGPRVESKPRLELYVVSGNVRASLSPEFFRRP